MTAVATPPFSPDAPAPRSRFSRLFRSEVRRAHGLWNRVEPGRTRRRAWAIAGETLVVLVVVGAMGGWLFGLVRETVRWENLRSRGVTAQALIVDTTIVDEGDGYNYYLKTDVAECHCFVTVRVTSIDDHEWWTSIPIRFDPRDHSNAVPLVDRPGDNLAVGIVFFVITLAALATTEALIVRRRLRCRALLRHAADERSVKFRVWRRQGGKSYLVLYDAGTSDWDTPICCVPVSRRSVRRLRAHDVLRLYSSPDLASVALRKEGTVILPTGTVKAGRWEQSRRTE
jgi:hypothetical protein